MPLPLILPPVPPPSQVAEVALVSTELHTEQSADLALTKLNALSEALVPEDTVVKQVYVSQASLLLPIAQAEAAPVSNSTSSEPLNPDPLILEPAEPIDRSEESPPRGQSD
ncbi:MAG: hypothetical protein WBG38_06425, partial [Nodosilinea sp.]